MTPKLIVIDGFNALHRGYGANNTDGFGAIRSVFFKIITQMRLGATHVVVVYDTPTGKQSRERILKSLRSNIKQTKVAAPTEYKGRRGPKPEDFRKNYDLSRELLRVMGITFVDAFHSEADDVMASFSRKYGKHAEVILITNDKDLYPTLIYGNIHNGTTLVTHFVFEHTYGFNPAFWVDYTALKGKIDQVPGVLGIGPSQAVSLIKKYRTVEKLYASLHKLYECTELRDWFSTYQLLAGQYSTVLLGKKLAALNDTQDVPDLNSLRIKPGVYDKGFDFMKKNKCLV